MKTSGFNLAYIHKQSTHSYENNSTIMNINGLKLARNLAHSYEKNITIINTNGLKLAHGSGWVGNKIS